MIFSISMSTCVDIHFIIGDQIYSFGKQTIEHFVDSKFISRNSRWWHEDSISFFEYYLGMFASRHSCKRSKFFSLCSGTKNKHSFIRHVIYFIIKFTDHTFRCVDISKLLTDIYIINHRSSWEEDYSIISDSTIDNLDNSTNIGSKGSDNHSS